MLVALDEWCVSCGDRFYAGTVTAPKEHTQHLTILYGANDTQFLCGDCAQYEEREYERRGTNSMPDLLESYRADSTIRPPEQD